MVITVQNLRGDVSSEIYGVQEKKQKKKDRKNAKSLFWNKHSKRSSLDKCVGLRYGQCWLTH